MDLSSDPRLNHRFPVERGLRAEECGEQLRAFFRSRRATSGAAGEKSGSSAAWLRGEIG